MVFVKNIKWSSLFIALLYAAAGVYLFMYPQTDTETICEVLGIGCIIFYFLMDVRAALFRNDFVEGIILILLGGVVIYQMKSVKPLVPFILAIVIAGSGVKKLQDGIDVGRIGYPHTWTYLIMAVISIALGALVMLQYDVLSSISVRQDPPVPEGTECTGAGSTGSDRPGSGEETGA